MMENKYEIPFTARGNAFPGSVNGRMPYVNQPYPMHNNCATSAASENEGIYIVSSPQVGNNTNNNPVGKKDWLIRTTFASVLSAFSALVALTALFLALLYHPQEEGRAQLDKLQGDYQTLAENYSMLLANFSREIEIAEERLNNLTFGNATMIERLKNQVNAIETTLQEEIYSICSNQNHVKTSSGKVTSQGFPGRYLNSLDCETTISPPSTHQGLSFNFSSFSLESHLTCNFDYMEIYKGSQQLGKYCGSALPNDFNSTSTVRLVFHTDGSITSNGFQLEWKLV